MFTERRQMYAWDALKQTGFTHNACGPFTKNQERIKKFYSSRKYRLYLQEWSW